MTSEGLGEVLKGDSADMCAEKFPLVLMGGRGNLSSERKLHSIINFLQEGRVRQLVRGWVRGRMQKNSSTIEASFNYDSRELEFVAASEY